MFAEGGEVACGKPVFEGVGRGAEFAFGGAGSGGFLGVGAIGAEPGLGKRFFERVHDLRVAWGWAE